MFIEKGLMLKSLENATNYSKGFAGVETNQVFYAFYFLDAVFGIVSVILTKVLIKTHLNVSLTEWELQML